MEFLLTIEEQPVILNRESDASFSSGKTFHRFTYNASAAPVIIIARHFKGTRFDIWHTDYSFSNPAKLTARSVRPVRILHFFSGQTVRVIINGTSYLLSDQQFNISFFSSIEAVIHAPDKLNFQTFHIHFEQGFLEQFADDSQNFLAFLNDINSGKSGSLTDMRHFWTPEMPLLIGDIIESPYTGKNADIFTSTQVNLLFLKAVTKINSGYNMQKSFRLTDTEKQTLHQVKEFLTGHKAEVVTLSQIARLAAMNPGKLQKGFKHLFGSSIIAYHESLRMEEGRKLVMETEMTIAEIAYTLHYKSPSHFSDAFKRTFRFSPHHLRKR